ncbi:MAG: 50S ribosomal protein L10 [Oscillospiraceae bacterium]|nr:50S ribosomal protein L10 [Oscillospiraceae bacterium]
MPSKEVLLQKQQAVSDLSAKLKDAKSVVLVDYKGISVADDTKLRAELRAEGVEYKVIKNTLLTFACKDAGLDALLPHLSGTTAVAISDDEIAPARVINKYVLKNKNFFNLKPGYIDGQFADVDMLTSIASLPSREGLIAQVAGSLNGIIASLARAVSEVAKKTA